MAQDFKHGPWEPVRSYDAFWVGVDGLLTEKRTASAIWDVLHAPENLSPKERETAVTRIKDYVGRNPVSDTLIDIATNPFVWLSFLISPAGASAVKSGGRLFNHGMRGYNAYIREQGPGLRWLAAGWQWLDGTPIGRALHESQRNIEKLVNEGADEIHTPLVELLGKIGAHEKHGLNYNARANKKRGVSDRLRRISDALHVSLSGADYDQVIGQTEWMPRMFVFDKTGKELAEISPHTEDGITKLRELFLQWKEYGLQKGGTMKVKFKGDKDFTVIHTKPGRGSDAMRMVNLAGTGKTGRVLPRWTKDVGAAEQILRAEGAWELREAINRTMKGRFFRMFGKVPKGMTEDEVVAQILKTGNTYLAGPTKDILDENKILRLWRNLNRVELTGHLAGEDYNFVHMLMDRHTRKALRKGTMGESEFLDLVKEGFASRVALDAYMPRNVVDFAQWDETLGQVKKVVPDGPSQRKAIEGSGKAVLTSTQRAYPRTAEDVTWHPDDLDRIKDSFSAAGGVSDELNALHAVSLKNIQEQTAFSRVTPVYRVDPHENIRRYLRGTARSYAAHIAEPSQFLLRLEQKLKRNAKKYLNFGELDISRTGEKIDRRMQADQIWQKPLLPGVDQAGKPIKVTKGIGLDIPILDIPGNWAPAGGWSIADVIDGTVRALPRVGTELGQLDDYARNPVGKFITEALIPGAFGQVHYNTSPIRWALQKGQYLAAMFARGPIGKHMESWGPQFKQFVNYADELSKADTEYGARWLSKGTTNYLYTSHLGLNLASVMLNLSQPWLLASAWTGAGGIFHGYKEAMTDLMSAVSDRVSMTLSGKIPLRMSPFEREEFYRNRIRFFDEADLGDGLAELDVFLQAERPRVRPSRKKWLVFEATMKAFEKAEWFNRLTVAHAAHRLHKSPLKFGPNKEILNRGLPGVENVIDDVHRTVQETQFGSGLLNTPAMFLPNGTWASPLFAHPLMRQFQTFVTRSFYGPLFMPSRVGMGRKIGLQNLGIDANITVNHPLLVTMADMTKLAAYSSIMYYGAKNLLGTDYSRAGFFNVVGEATGLTEGRIKEQDTPQIPILNFFDRPVVSALWGTFRGVSGTGEDGELARSLVRWAPGGIGLHRIINALPPGVDGIPLVDLQTKYADYSNPDPKGNIPIFKSDGSLVEYRPVSQVIMGALGVDLNKHRKAGDFDHWLVTQRDQIVKHRQIYLNALNAKDHSQAQQIQAKFQKKFGFPLTVSKEQLRAYFRRRNVPRTERILDRLPREIRPEMMEIVAQTRMQNLGMEEEDFLSKDTATQRTRAFGRTSQSTLPENVELINNPQDLMRLMEEQKKQPQSPEERGYVGYRPYK